MYSRSLTERIKIRLEIMYENFLDFLGHNAMRKPMLIFVGIALFVTLRNSKHMISKLKKSSYLSPFNSRYSSSASLSSLYGSTASSLYSNGSSSGSQNDNSYGGSSASSYGGPASYGTQYNSSPSSSSYGMGGTTSAYQQPYGQSTSSTYQQPYGQSTYNNNLRGGTQMMSTSTFSTSRLVDQYRGSIQVAQGGLFHDYGGMSSFTGQIDTLSTMDSSMAVQQALSSPGNGKVLVVDGHASYNGALFDASMANTALSNGWKGIIINGVIRNAEELKSVQFGVKALGAHPSPGQQQQPGQRGMAVSFGGVNFSPGNYVYADSEGIVVSATSLGVGGGGGGGIISQSSNGYASTNTYGASNSYTNPGVGSSTYSTHQANAYGGVQGSTYQNSGQMNSYQSPQSASYSQGQGSMYTSANNLSTGMARTGSFNNGVTSPYSSYSRTANRLPFSKSSSFSFGQQRKKPSKKTLLGLLLIVCVVGWVCMSD